MIKWNLPVSLLLLAVMFSATPASASCAPLDRTLGVGQKGEDVRALQIFLNKDEVTRLSQFGSGSAGLETTYFGPLLRAAVKKFQLQHKKEVLTPLGLTVPTGFVGKLTSSVINQKICAASSAAAISTTTLVTASGSEKNIPRVIDQAEIDKQKLELANKIDQLMLLMKKNPSNSNAITSPPVVLTPAVSSGISLPLISRTSAALVVDPNAPLLLFNFNTNVVTRGMSLSVQGSGITEGTELVLGVKHYPLNILQPGSAGTIALPLDAPLGKYYATLEKGSRKSNERILIVAEDLSHQPVIESISPETGNYGTVVVIKGSGFTARNDIFTSLERIHDIISSDGKTITFSVHSDPKLLDKNGKLVPGAPYAIGIVNEHGISQFTQFKIQ